MERDEDVLDIVTTRMRAERAPPVTPLALGFWFNVRLTREERATLSRLEASLDPVAWQACLVGALVASGRYASEDGVHLRRVAFDGRSV